MKNLFRLFLLSSALTLTFVACERENDVIPNNDDNTNVERNIIYSIGNNENHLNLETEAEWDAMLDMMCDQACNGYEVSFYNENQKTLIQHNRKGASKDSQTISTTNRDELKSWMKEMEKKGLTVHITYDDGSGTWHGKAYATAPSDSTLGELLGTWHLNGMVVVQFDLEGNVQSSDLFEPEEGTGTMYYSFSTDGTVTLTMIGMDGTNVTDNGTWLLSDDGILSSQLLPNGVDWNVNWISSNTMILSHHDIGTEDGDFFYQLHFEAVEDF